MTRSYILDEHGEPVPCEDLETLGAWWANNPNRHVARDELPGDVLVSTVFLALNYEWREGAPPVLWETMVFGGPLDGEQERYVSRADAVAGHARWLAKVKAR